MSSQPTPPFAVALDTEIASTERVILEKVALHPVGPNDPNVVRLRDLKELREKHFSGPVADVDRAIAILGSDESGRTTIAAHTFSPASSERSVVPQVFFRSPGRKQSPERQRALAAARQFLLEKTNPVKTNDIYQHLVAQGLGIGGVDPVNNLSAALSHAAGFRSHGKSGWTLETQVAAG